ncbi:4Fe-4S ferredoxin [Clostridiales bacterium PH28_bin88]|nr:4Fe-4S ferredoxin [Clostridiales bacterium PH28_bin88]
MLPIKIDLNRCNGCGLCEKNCPGDLIFMQDGLPVVKYPDECWFCGACRIDCPEACIQIVFPLSVV